MLYSEIIAVCSQIHTKHINTLCGQNVGFMYVNHGGTYTNHPSVKSYLQMWHTPLLLFTPEVGWPQ
jgi:hypothetical protein